VDAWDVLAWRPASDDAPAELDVRITCGGGTYVRSLARDLGRLVASAAHLSALRRVRSGPFHVADAVTVDRLREGGAPLLPPIAALPTTPVEAIDAATVARVVRGIEVPATVSGALGALVHADTSVLVALAERRGERWQPRVVMRPVPVGTG
jgi:tRNA pseudouridine55 synthase